ILVDLTRAVKDEHPSSIPIPLSFQAIAPPYRLRRLRIQAVRPSSWSISRHIQGQIMEWMWRKWWIVWRKWRKVGSGEWGVGSGEGLAIPPPYSPLPTPTPAHIICNWKVLAALLLTVSIASIFPAPARLAGI